MKKKLCVVTGTRAEYGLLRFLMEGIERSSVLRLQVIATGIHLSPEFGLTYGEIEQEGFRIDKKVEMVLSADTPSAIAKSTGLGMIGFADAFVELKPDAVVILGDRYEMLSAAFPALSARIPIVHISGGETTEGAFDEAIRHSISKMAWLHFVAAEDYRQRVIQLGEDPGRVFNVGGLGVDTIRRTGLLSRDELVRKTGIQLGGQNLMVTYHPVTLGHNSSQKQFQKLLNVLDEAKDIYLIFTMPNSDPDGRVIKQMIDDFVSSQSKRSVVFNSMGQLTYLSALQYMDGMVGNSSSGLTEAPTFKIGTVNIGDRQKGRLRAESVIDCEPTEDSIREALKKLYSEEFRDTLKTVENPYGDGGATARILDVLEKAPLPKLPQKRFYNL